MASAGVDATSMQHTFRLEHEPWRANVKNDLTEHTRHIFFLFSTANTLLKSHSHVFIFHPFFFFNLSDTEHTALIIETIAL